MKRFEGTRAVLWAARQPEMAQAGKVLERLGCEVLALNSLEELRAEMRSDGVDLIVTRICPCCAEWKELLREDGTEEMPPVVVIASAFDVDLYLEAMRRGAFDCTGLPLNESELLRIAAKAMDREEVQEMSHAGAQP